MRTRLDARLSKKRTACISESSATIDLTLEKSPKKDKAGPVKSSKSASFQSKAETKVKTPKVKSFRNSKTVVNTPGRVNTPGKDDFLLSQHFDSQVVVGWDCNSPDTIRGIKRFTSGENGDDVSELVMQLIGDEQEDTLPAKRSTPPLLGVWRESTEDKLLDDHISNKKRLRQRKKSGKESSVSKELLNKLSLALDKCPEDEADVERSENEDSFQSENESNMNVHNCSEDLFSSIHENHDHAQASKHARVSPRLAEKKSVLQDFKSLTVQNHLETREEIEKNNGSSSRHHTEVTDDWSDDELFDDDSIIRETQVSIDAKCVSLVHGIKRKSSDESFLPKTKNTRYAFKAGGTMQNQRTSRSNNFTNLQIRPQSNIKTGLNSVACPSSSEPRAQSSFASPGARLKARFDQTSSLSRAVSSADRNKTGGATQLCMNANTNKQSVPIHSFGAQKQDVRQVSQHFYPKNTYTSRPVLRQNANMASTSSKPVLRNSSKPLSSLHSSNTSCDKSQRPESFKKHNSFSGSNSPKSASSRRRSLSGSDFDDKLGNAEFTVVLRPSSSNNKVTSSKQTVTSFSGKGRGCCTKGSLSFGNTGANGSICSSSKSLAVNSSVVTTAASHTSSVVSSTFVKPLPSIPEVTKSRLTPDEFDTSFSDELLSQLAEPDDMLDSQMVLDNTVVSASNTVGIKLPVTRTPVIPVRSNLPVTCVKQSVSVSAKCVQSEAGGHVSSVVSSKGASLSSQSSVKSVNPSNIESDTRPVTRSSRLVHTVPNSTAKQYKFHASGSEARHTTHSMETGQKQPVPRTTEQPKQGEVIPVAVGQYSEDLFASDDDLLLEDDDLTEPQALALLEEAELLATQQQISTKHRNSTESLAKTVSSNSTSESSKIGSAGGDTDTVRSGSSDQGSEPSGSQGSSSQTKYSAEEIERKKQEALERRKKKLEQSKAVR